MTTRMWCHSLSDRFHPVADLHPVPRLHHESVDCELLLQILQIIEEASQMEIMQKGTHFEQ